MYQSLTDENLEKALLQYRTGLLYDQAKAGLLTNVVIAGLVFLILQPISGRVQLVSWLLTVVLITMLRLGAVYLYHSKFRYDYSPLVWRNVYLSGALLAGLSWGCGGIYLFPLNSNIHQMMLIAILSGMLAGGTNVLAADRLTLGVFVGSLVLPFAFYLFSKGDALYTFVGIGGIFFAMVLMYIANNAYLRMVEAYRLQLQNKSLLRSMVHSKSELERVNTVLKNEVEERKKAQDILQELANELDKRVKERTRELTRVNQNLQEQFEKRIAMENELYDQRDKAEVTLNSIGEGVISTDAQGAVVYLNNAALQVLGVEIKNARGKIWSSVLRVIDEVTQEPITGAVEQCLRERKVIRFPASAMLVDVAKTALPVEVTVSPMLDRSKKVRGSVIIFRDVSEARELRKQLFYHATHDPLTGLVNRREFENQLHAALSEAKRDNVLHALLYLDLDQFKIVNDTCGHSAGDELLKQLTNLLHKKMRETDVLGRLGGDEFGILLKNCPLAKAVEIAKKLLETVKDFRFAWQSKSFEMGVSIGLVEINQSSENLNRILSASDVACFTAKDLGRNRLHIYTEDDLMLLERHRQMDWVGRLKQALALDRFMFFYQPIVPVGSAYAHSHHEILLRMVGENDEIIPPGSFITAAERYNVMPAIDRWVIRRVFHNYEAISREIDNESPLLSLNLSGESFADDSLLDFILFELGSSGIDPAVICFEITETAAIANLTTAMHFVKHLKQRGCKFALDDFGSGVSSFGYLKNLPVDYLKIDGSFVKDMHNDKIDKAMVESIHRVGKVMEIQTIAEFVENKQILLELEKIQVDFAQGYAISKPLPLYIDKVIH